MNNHNHQTPRHITGPGDNIFTDLGFPAERAEALLQQSNLEITQLIGMKKMVMAEISHWMDDNNVRQLQAAAVMGVSRPRISDVVNQKTEKFTLDALIAMAGMIGKRVRLVIE